MVHFTTTPSVFDFFVDFTEIQKKWPSVLSLSDRDSDAAQINTFPQYHSFSGRYLIKPIPLVGDGEVSGKNSQV